MADPKAIAKRLAALRTIRSPNESVWRECFNFTFPLRASGFQSDTLDAQGGQDRRAQACDGTAVDAARTLASGLMSGLTPPQSMWFELQVENASEDEKRWLEQAGKLVFEKIHGANFDAAAYECQLDVVAAGWFVMYVDSDVPKKRLVFDQWPLAQCYFACSKPGGPVDTVYRHYKLTAEACFNEYGDECSDTTKKLAQDKPDELIELVRAIYPRSEADGYIPGSMLSKRMPFASCHVEVKAEKILREGGYQEFPLIVPRWQKLPESEYAVGPTFDALPDVKTINQLTKDELAVADLAVGGMWIAEDDGVLNPRTVKVGPRKVICANSVDSMKALEPASNWQYSEALGARLQSMIRKTFMADQLQPVDGPQMTATEVRVRVELIRQLLGPVYGRLQSEYLAPLVERSYALCARMGIFPPPPESLLKRTYEVRYSSPLARAQRGEDVAAMDQFETVLLQEATANPNVMDVYNWDEAVATRGELLGVPAKLIRSPDEIKVVRDARNAAQAEAARQAAIQAGATSFAETAGQQAATR